MEKSKKTAESKSSKQTCLDDLFLWSEDKKSSYIKELHAHIESLYEEIDSQQKDLNSYCDETYQKERLIDRLTDSNQSLAKQVLDLKAQLYDLLR